MKLQQIRSHSLEDKMATKVVSGQRPGLQENI